MIITPVHVNHVEIILEMITTGRNWDMNVACDPLLMQIRTVSFVSDRFSSIPLKVHSSPSPSVSGEARDGIYRKSEGNQKDIWSQNGGVLSHGGTPLHPNVPFEFPLQTNQP